MTPTDIKSLKDKSGLSWPGFADAIGVSPRICRYWAAGEKSPGKLATKSLERFAARLDRAAVKRAKLEK